ncbi:SDR family oxidoreductase [Luteococcus sediminum]|uniref:SDR family oxidoreductase n=1 Tax=Luteococcus sp. TaxID=1969402 RepID=UPI003735F4A2
MRVAVVGGGTSGTAIQHAVEEWGTECVMMSRRTGFDIRDPRASDRLAGFDVVIEATGGTFLRRRPAVEFFTTSTRTIAQATRDNGGRHVLLSIVNCDLPEVQGYGYFAAKAEQERLARQMSPQLSIIRSTQWFEFAAQNQQRMKLGPIAIVPAMKIQPVALDSVAAAIAHEALSEQPHDVVEVAGQDVMTLQELTLSICPRHPYPVEVTIPTAYGTAFTSGALVPSPTASIVGPSLDDWRASRETT